MTQQNGRLVVLVAAVAVAAVAVGGALAYRQTPSDAKSAAVPLAAPSSTPTPGQAPTPAPATTPFVTPEPPGTPTYAGSTTIDLAVTKLPAGRAPQLPYLVDREINGGAGQPVKIPGFAIILQAVRQNAGVLAVVARQSAVNNVLEYGSDLYRVGGVEEGKIPGVTSVVTRPDQSAVAYAAERYNAGGDVIKGGDVYADTGGAVRRLKLPKIWNVAVLTYSGDTVYFRGADTSGGTPKLYQWKTNTTTATRVADVVSPTRVASDGSVALSTTQLADGSCSTVTTLATGKQLWRSCEYKLGGFTPDSRTLVGKVSIGDNSCNPAVTALDAATGKLLRQWKGCFLDAVAEDDQHLLIVAVYAGNPLRPGYQRAVIRCAVTTGQCERATAIVTDKVLSLE